MMTLAAQQAALAKHLGLDRQFVLMKRGLFYRPDAQGYTDQLSEAWKVSEAVAKEHENPHGIWVTMHPLPWPDWAGDLNAIAAAVATVTDPFKQGLYLAYLGDTAWQRESATAAQRLEALLRTLNLWDDAA